VQFFMGLSLLSLRAAMDRLPSHFLYRLFQRVEARGPELVIAFDPGRCFLQPARAELAGPHTPNPLRNDQPCLLRDADMLLHAPEGHAELPGQLGNGAVNLTGRWLNKPFADGRLAERGWFD
jgi:hypothetical protein